MKKVVLAKALTEIQHADPAVGSMNDSNTTTFNRQKVLVKNRLTGYSVDKCKWLIDNYKVPTSIANYFDNINIVEFASCCLVYEIISTYASGEGYGLLQGTTRYPRLISRLVVATQKSQDIKEFWNTLVKDLDVVNILPYNSNSRDNIIPLLKAIEPIEQTVIFYIANNVQTVIALSRSWKDADVEISKELEENKKKSDDIDIFNPQEEVKRKRSEFYTTANVNTDIANTDELVELEIPAFQTNGIRSKLRKAAFDHLCKVLDIPKGKLPGGGTLPAGVEALFYNGNNIAKGAESKGNSFLISSQIKATFPSVDVFSGCTDGMILGDGMLTMNNWLVCKENKETVMKYTKNVSDNTDTPAAKFLTDMTHTRHASSQGVGQMIYNFEAVVPGTEFVIIYTLNRFTEPLSIGAFQCAFEIFNEHPVIGGKSAEGYGLLELTTIFDDMPDYRQLYIDYLNNNKEMLLAELEKGTLGTGQVVCS